MEDNVSYEPRARLRNNSKGSKPQHHLLQFYLKNVKYVYDARFLEKPADQVSFFAMMDCRSVTQSKRCQNRIVCELQHIFGWKSILELFLSKSKTYLNYGSQKLFMTWELGNITFHEHFQEIEGLKEVEVSEDYWVLGNYQGHFSILLLQNKLYLKQNN